MARDAAVPEWPRWFRLLCFGLVAAIVLGLTYRTLEDAASAREAVRGLAGIGLFCLWIGYTYLSKTRWRDRNARNGLALLGCLAISGAVLSALAADSERWLDRELAITFGVGMLFALALVLSRYVSLSRRAFGVLAAAAGVGLVALGLSGFGSGAFGWLETVIGGVICLTIGTLYAIRPGEMARLEQRYRDAEDSSDP